MKTQEKKFYVMNLKHLKITVFNDLQENYHLAQMHEKRYPGLFQRSQKTQLTAHSHERQVNAEREEEEEEEGVLRLQEEIASSRASQKREGDQWQCRTRTRSRSPSEVGTRSSDVSRGAA